MFFFRRLTDPENMHRFTTQARASSVRVTATPSPNDTCAIIPLPRRTSIRRIRNLSSLTCQNAGRTDRTGSCCVVGGRPLEKLIG